MAGKIRILPEELSNQIAAGEVIERPASVVKEAVENALDAGATRIEVDLERGGTGLIRVRDNGEGMSREDALLAFARHATSKIRTAGDLGSLATLGFRGEALSSIAAVSRVRLQTLCDGEGAGVEIEVAAGERNGVREAGLPRGTVLEVRDLFFNVPARRKFLKSETTELAHVSRVLHDLAMAHCGTHLRLRHGERVLMDALPAPDRVQRLASVVGSQAVRTLVSLECRRGSLSLEALVSKPGGGRRDRAAQHFYVNGRPVRDRSLSHALQTATRTLFPHDVFPVAYLFLALDPREVDVNVHPTKAEVRFARNQEVHQFIAENLRFRLLQALRGEGEGPLSAPPVETPFPASPPARSEDAVREAPAPFFPSGLFPARPRFPVDARPGPLAAEPPVRPPPLSADLIQLSPLGQLDQTFLLFEGPRGLYLVDQHTAHERVLYERFRRQWERGAVEIQGLLIPEVVELEAEQAVRVRAHLPQLETMGFEVEAFGGNSFAIRGAPAPLLDQGIRSLFLGLAERLGKEGSRVSLADPADAVAQVMACHQAVRAHDPLGTEEMRALLRELMAAESPFTCPHGRPTVLFWSLEELKKEFLRK